MKKIFLAVLVVAIALIGVTAAMANVANTGHDLHLVGGGGTSTETCVYCHTPHQLAAANKQAPLWNRTLSSTSSYPVYANSTINATINPITYSALGTATTTHLCLSCHDGTTSVNVPLRAPRTGSTGAATSMATINGGAASLGTDLSDDHPVNFVYTTSSADAGILAAASLPATLPLDGAGRMQCATCHNVHDNTNVPFLRVSNTASGLCTTCHINK